MKKVANSHAVESADGLEWGRETRGNDDLTLEALAMPAPDNEPAHTALSVAAIRGISIQAAHRSIERLMRRGEVECAQARVGNKRYYRIVGRAK